MIRFYVIGEKIMYTAKMYVKDRAWILSQLDNIRDSYDCNGFDILPDDDWKVEFNRRIKSHQEMLVIIRHRYYSQWEN